MINANQTYCEMKSELLYKMVVNESEQGWSIMQVDFLNDTYPMDQAVIGFLDCICNNNYSDSGVDF